MVRLILLLAALALGWYGYSYSTPKHWPAGILVTHEPYQGPSYANATPMHKGDYTIHPLAQYVLDARVLSKAHYSDDLGPYDLALGWQQMSDSALLDKLEISQYDRFYQYHWPDSPPADPHIIARTSANTHMLPASDAVLKTLKHVREGDLVHIEGYLVHVDRADGWQWQSSMTRDDQGPGACEVVWVESLTILDKPPA